MHNLNEDECLKVFEPVLLGIEVILDQKLEVARRAEKEKRARDALARLRVVETDEKGS